MVGRVGLGKSLRVRSVNNDFKGWRARGPRENSIANHKGSNSVGYGCMGSQNHARSLLHGNF